MVFDIQYRSLVTVADILFEDFTHVKFYRLSLRASVEVDAGPFDDGFDHVDDWVPQRLVTATGPNPLPW